MDLCQGDSSRNPEPETRRAQSHSIIIVCDRDRFILARPAIRRFPPPPPRISPFELYILNTTLHSSIQHSMTQRRHEISYSRKKMKKNLYLFTLFSFLSSFLPQLFSPIIKSFYSARVSSIRGDSLHDFFNRLTFTRPSFSLGRGEGVIINVQVELGQANNLRVKGTGGDRERR